MGKLQIAATIVLAVILCPASAERSTPVLQLFEFLGCSGAWGGELQDPEVWRLETEERVSFLVHSVASCGLSGRNPVVAGGPELLDLRYELFSDSDGVELCDCEYWARFTFGPDAHLVQAATLNGEKTVLRGEWPED